MNSKLIELEAGEMSQAFNLQTALEIYNNLPIFQSKPFEEYYHRNLDFIMSVDRWEYMVYDENGCVSSLIIFCVDEDVHVGECMLVMCAYSREGSTLSGGYRKAISEAKALGLEWFVYSKQISPTEHRTIFKELR